MKAWLLGGARATLLIGPGVLAFWTGGYFDGPRDVAGVVAWALVALALLTLPRRLPRNRAALAGLAGLALLAGWTLASIAWAPIAGSAYHAGQRLVLYVGALAAALLRLRTEASRRAVEPVLAAGTLVVIGYGISERLLPGLLHFSRSVTAEGRLEQPLTYWNAMGELAAIGVVLCARLAGDNSRDARLRLAAIAASAPLGLGLYLSFSRGALFACATGLLALIVLAPQTEQLRAIAVTVAAGVLASAGASPFSGVTALLGSQSTRERQGAITLILLAVVIAVSCLAYQRLQREERSRPIRLPAHAPLIATAVVCAGLAVAIVVGAKERAARPLAAGASRYTSLESNRYAYWRVALRAFEDEPVRGVGAGGWAVYWLRYRPFAEYAQDAHSLPLQTLAELGLVGVAFLLTFFGGIAVAAVRAARAAPAVAAGPAAGFIVYAAHAPLDWDWQMPALTLVALVLGGLLLILAEGPARVA